MLLWEIYTLSQVTFIEEPLENKENTLARAHCSWGTLKQSSEAISSITNSQKESSLSTRTTSIKASWLTIYLMAKGLRQVY